VYGISGNKRSWYDNSNAERLGYKPQDDSETYAIDVLAKEKPGNDPRSEMHQGGNFVMAEIGGDPSRVTPKLKRKKR
jgi:uronate dehydrogenase